MIAGQHGLEAVLEQLGSEVHEADAVEDLGLVEERELLLVAQHLERRLAEDGDVQRRPLGGRGREHDLVRERRLAAAGPAGDQVERELGQSAAEDVVETGDSRSPAS